MKWEELLSEKCVIQLKNEENSFLNVKYKE